MPWYPHLLYYWVYPPQPTYGKLFVRTYFYLWSSVRISSSYGNLFCLWESLLFMIICGSLYFLWESVLIYDHLWEYLLFMRIFFESLLIYDHLWESFPFMRIFLNLFSPFMRIFLKFFLFFICAYLFLSSFYHSCIHLE